MRLRAGVALLLGVGLAATQSFAADEWGGSAALTSDYFVRGISRTSNHAALQLDFHYSNPNGFVAGVFASNSQIDRSEPTDVELSGFLGYVWKIDDAWRARVLANHYAYPWNRAGSNYNYDELDLDVSYEGWLHVGLGYSPNSPRFLPYPYPGLIGVTEKSADVSAQRQIFGNLSLTAGVGYSFLDGPESGGYVYWSGGAAYDFRAFSVAVAYVNTSAEAKALFYNAAATGQWTGTIIWRF
ncbi:MAG TPA: TorF family putative porin [Steroidobacteraceae bacterium]|nr:TorF family putative porin [Steroidobacteraceae bacterium]